jgi:hypothetical protein
VGLCCPILGTPVVVRDVAALSSEDCSQLGLRHVSGEVSGDVDASACACAGSGADYGGGQSGVPEADAVRGRIDWKYCLALALTDPGFDFSVLSQFRTRLVTHDLQGMAFEILLTGWSSRGWSPRGRQRTDATHVVAAVRHLNRLEMVGETLRAALEALIRDRDGKYPALFDAILTDAGIAVVLSGVHIPRMNSIMQRWVRTCRHELLNRTLILNQRHLLHALPEYEVFSNAHRPHQGIANARPLVALPEPITDPDRLAHLNIHRRDRLGGTLREYQHAA